MHFLMSISFFWKRGIFADYKNQGKLPKEEFLQEMYELLHKARFLSNKSHLITNWHVSI